MGYKYNRTNIKYVIVNGYLKCKMLFYYLSVGFYGVLLTLSNANRLHNRCPNTNMAKMYIQHSRFFFVNEFQAHGDSDVGDIVMLAAFFVDGD